jgi:hypothetical protein
MISVKSEFGKAVIGFAVLSVMLALSLLLEKLML